MQNLRTVGLILKKVRDHFNLTDKHGKIIRCASLINAHICQELKENPTAEMRKLLGHLNLKVEEGRLECIEKHSTGSFHRVKHQEESPFTEELHTLLDKTITEARTAKSGVVWDFVVLNEQQSSGRHHVRPEMTR